jgi:hypothetical protein
MRPRSLFVSILACTLGACSTADKSSSNEPDSPTPTSSAASGEASEDYVIGTTSKQLPPELLAELRLRGDDVDGRLLTLAPGFVATAECSDCGAPSYLWFLAVRCADARHCEVLTEQCEGVIGREEDQAFVLEFRPIEGGSPEACAGYSGTFEPTR